MDFSKYILTAHSVYSESSPLRTTLILTSGLIVGGWLYFPSGPAAKLHVKVLRGLHQIYPSSAGENISLDDCVVPINVNLDLSEIPRSLDILTWNDSTSEDHALTICFFLDPYAPPRKTLLQRLTGK